MKVTAIALPWNWLNRISLPSWFIHESSGRMSPGLKSFARRMSSGVSVRSGDPLPVTAMPSSQLSIRDTASVAWMLSPGARGVRRVRSWTLNGMIIAFIKLGIASCATVSVALMVSIATILPLRGNVTSSACPSPFREQEIETRRRRGRTSGNRLMATPKKISTLCDCDRVGIWVPRFSPRPASSPIKHGL